MSVQCLGDEKVSGARCRFDMDACAQCGRTVLEVAGWRHYSPAEKRIVKAKAEIRRQKHARVVAD